MLVKNYFTFLQSVPELIESKHSPLANTDSESKAKGQWDELWAGLLPHPTVCTLNAIANEVDKSGSEPL